METSTWDVGLVESQDMEGSSSRFVERNEEGNQKKKTLSEENQRDGDGSASGGRNVDVAQPP